MSDAFSRSQSKVILEGKNRCLLEKDDSLILKFVGENCESNSRNFALLFRILKDVGVKTYFRGQVSLYEHEICSSHLLPVAHRICSIANKDLAQRFGLSEGTRLGSVIPEWIFYSDQLSNPQVTEDHILNFNLLSKSEMGQIKEQSLQAFYSLRGFFLARGYLLGSVLLRFGKNDWADTIVADEVAAADLELWDLDSFRLLDQSPAALTKVLAPTLRPQC